MVDSILEQLLILDQNETVNLKNEVYVKFKDLIIELTKVKYNIRFCTNEKCKCHPESRIEVLISDDDLNKFLKTHKVYEKIIQLVSKYEPITIKKFEGE